MFNLAQFAQSFDATLERLASAERITKDTLRDLSRDLLSVTHETEDIGFVNRTIEVLTPVNKKVAILFFTKFSGFKFGEDTGKFFKKDKKVWADVVADVAKRLEEDPHFNMWTWAEQNVEMAPKKFALAEVTVFAKRVLKKAEKEGLSQSDVLKAFIEGGFEPDALVALMGAMAPADEQAE